VCEITLSYNKKAAHQLNITDKNTKLATHKKMALGYSLKAK
jgi:hypothetical protein